MPRTISTINDQLHAAQLSTSIVQFSRTFEGGTMSGYVLDVGPKFFLMAILNDGLEFEHYSCVRMKDIRGLESPAKRESFYKAVRKIRKDKMPRKIKIDLSDAATIMRSLRPSMITVYREKISPDTCIIGRLRSEDGKHFEFLEIGPDAHWESEPSFYRLNQITRIDLPGPYEKALLLVGGKPKDTL